MGWLDGLRRALCGQRIRRDAGRQQPRPESVLTRHADQLMRVRGVLSVGIGQTDDGQPAIVVGVMGDEGAESTLPNALDGVPLIVKRTGRIEAL